MKLNSCSGTNSVWRDTVVLDPSRTECTLVLHFFLSHTHAHSSSHDWVLGASVKMSPSLLFLNMCSTACVSILVGDILRMWPRHASRLDRIARTKSNDRVPSLASSWGELSVMIATILLFAPLIALLISSVISHVSEPYVRIEHTLDIYNRIRSRRCSAFAVQMFRILPNLADYRFDFIVFLCHAMRVHTRCHVDLRRPFCFEFFGCSSIRMRVCSSVTSSRLLLAQLLFVRAVPRAARKSCLF